MFKKFKQQFKCFMTNKSAFSLVELIVVIAIMAVMAAVLAPSLLGYVEKSRAQKDDSAMGEVTNAIQLSLADQNIYDELLPYAVKGNFSCYCDDDASTNIDINKTVTKAPDYWLFNDECRKLDEIAYKPAGSMRGVTITLKPNGSAEYILKDGIINQIGDGTTEKGTVTGKTLNDAPEVYNRLRSTVGDTIKVSSQTYRNSDYTIFISMGTTGSNQADKQDAIQVYGQYNGTNLSSVVNANDISAPTNSQNPPSNNPSNNTPPEPVMQSISIAGATYTYTQGMTWRDLVEQNDNTPLIIATDENGDEVIYLNNVTASRRLCCDFYIVEQEVDFNKTYSGHELVGQYHVVVKADDLLWPLPYIYSSMNMYNLTHYDMTVIEGMTAYDDYYLLYENGTYRLCEVPY